MRKKKKSIVVVGGGGGRVIMCNKRTMQLRIRLPRFRYRDLKFSTAPKSGVAATSLFGELRYSS